jgi:flagellar biosynthesis protein FlhF
MHLKWFKGRAVSEVVSQIRKELGPEAVILHSKRSRGWGPLRAIRGGGVEILAAVDRAEPAPGRATAPVAGGGAGTDGLRAEVAALRHLLVQFGGGRLLAPALAPFYERLVAAGVEPALAQRLLGEVALPPSGERAPVPGALRARVTDALAGAIRTAAPASSGAARVALVGPPGAGKTTSLAPLAARAQIEGGRAGIINLDGGGLSQTSPLEAIASIADIPYAAALAPDDLAQELRRAPAGRLTLIDTFGVSPADAAGHARLGELLRAARPDEIHLVLSATTKTADALAAVRALEAAGITHLLFTRLDETTSLGSVLAVSVESGLPLSHFGTGREIPGDLVPASAREVVHKTLGMGAHCA